MPPSIVTLRARDAVLRPLQLGRAHRAGRRIMDLQANNVVPKTASQAANRPNSNAFLMSRVADEASATRDWHRSVRLKHSESRALQNHLVGRGEHADMAGA